MKQCIIRIKSKNKSIKSNFLSYEDYREKAYDFVVKNMSKEYNQLIISFGQLKTININYEQLEMIRDDSQGKYKTTNDVISDLFSKIKVYALEHLERF